MLDLKTFHIPCLANFLKHNKLKVLFKRRSWNDFSSEIRFCTIYFRFFIQINQNPSKFIYLSRKINVGFKQLRLSSIKSNQIKTIISIFINLKIPRLSCYPKTFTYFSSIIETKNAQKTIVWMLYSRNG